MKKSSSFIFVVIDLSDEKISEFFSKVEGEKSSFSESFGEIVVDELKKIYGIRDEEMELRHGLVNGVFNQIVLKNLR